MSDETTLLPCPFCGGEAHVVSDYSSEHDETRWSLWHECCEHDGESAGYGHALFPWFETPWYKTEAEAIAAWNTRTDYHGYEQAAIEAWKSIKAWNTRATHGTLTAEQVSKATYAHSIHADCADADWQAIADELNAELGSGTCIVTHDFNCSNCGKQIGVVRNCEMYETCDGQQAWKSLDHEVCDIPNYCPNCSAKVVG